MKFFEKIKVNVENGKLSKINFLNKTIYEYGRDKSNKKFYRLNILSKNNERSKNNENPVFYLKVNRNIEDTFICLQYWVDIISERNADFYILCDNKDLELKILKNIKFNNSDIKFIKSSKNPFINIVKKQNLHKKWYNAAFAHLSVFLHAKRNKIENFWNIDADDALFLTNTRNAIEILKKAEIYTTEQNLNALSFDFWVTKTKAKHWSFGLTYIQNNTDYFNAILNNIINWEDYKNYTSVHNIDWIFSSLKDKNILNLQTFYVENLYFLHWGRFFGDMKNSYIAVWNNGKMFYPIWNIFKDKRCIHDIPDSLIKFDLNLKQEDCLNFAMEYLVKLKRIPLDKV